jgi:hypothetical protein
MKDAQINSGFFVVAVSENIPGHAVCAIEKKEDGEDDPDLLGQVGKAWSEEDPEAEDKEESGYSNAEIFAEFLHPEVIG